MDEFTERIIFQPSFDHRFDPEKWRRGAGSMEIQFILGGPLGFVTANIMTGWMWEPLDALPVRGPVGSGPWSNEVRKRGTLGFDIFDHDRPRNPSPGATSCHAAQPPKGKEWFSSADGCTLIEGGTCYGDTGYLVTDTFVARLAQDGNEGGFGFLREIHDDWLADEVRP